MSLFPLYQVALLTSCGWSEFFCGVRQAQAFTVTIKTTPPVDRFNKRRFVTIITQATFAFHHRHDTRAIDIGLAEETFS